MSLENNFIHGSSLLLGDNTVPGLRVPDELQALLPRIYQEVRDYGCDFYETIVEMLTYSEISEVAAYGGFPVRYPHWQFGMEYEELQQGYQHGMHRIYEMVINTSPCYIYCLDSNTLVDNVTVVAHALGHCDFFKNNVFFSATHRGMMNKMANHGSRIRRYMQRWGNEKVTEFIDWLLRIDTLIDPTEAWDQKIIKDIVIRDHRTYKHPTRLHVPEGHDYMENYINTPEWIKQQQDKIERNDVSKEIGLLKNPTKNIFKFLKDNAPLRPWQADIASMLYEEALYFAPQRQTKTGNEGWACVQAKVLLPTNAGIITAKQLVEDKMSVNVFDGETNQSVSNWFIHENRKVITIRTNRGYTLGGSDNHRIIDGNGEWKQLQDFKVGESVKLSLGSNLWGPIQELPFIRIGGRTLASVRCDCGVSQRIINLYARAGKHVDTTVEQQVCLETGVLAVKTDRKDGLFSSKLRKIVKLPRICDEIFAEFVGLTTGDGHISDIKRTIGLTSGDYDLVKRYEYLVKTLFDIDIHIREEAETSERKTKWRCSFYSRTVRDLLIKIGMKSGIAARIKEIPPIILRSPEPVVRAFLRGLFDTDGYAGKRGVILSTSSHEMADQVQIVLANYGILSNQEPQDHDITNLTISSEAAKIFCEKIGFSLDRKIKKLETYVFGEDRYWFKKAPETDVIASIEYGEDTVYDISVDNTHKYSAQGFINHNSTIDYKMMCEKGLCGLGQKTSDSGIVEYSMHKMGVLGGKYSMNPYKLGFCLFKDIEERWNKGQFGTEWDECKDMQEREKWDRKLGLGHQKTFEVRRDYNDLTMISEFFTPEFCNKYEFFEWEKFPNGETKIKNRDFKSIKSKLMAKHLNGGLPDIRLTEPNYKGRGEMLLQHISDGTRELFTPYVKATLAAICAVWQRPVHLATKTMEGDEYVYSAHGTTDKEITYKTRAEFEKI